MELLLIRHAEPVELAAGTVEGTPDPALSARGRRQAAALVEVLAGEPIEAIYASPLRRAAETAQPLAADRGLTVHTDRDLAELHLGEREYVRITPDTDRRRASAALDVWFDAMASEAGRQAVADFRRRVRETTERIIAAHPGGTAVAVCHGGVINAVITDYLGVEELMVVKPHFASITTVRAARSGHRGVVSVNEHRHTRLAERLEQTP